MPQTKTKRINLRPLSRQDRDLIRIAHDAGHHGPDDSPIDVLSYWAETCGDCNARYYYEVCPGEFAWTAKLGKRDRLNERRAVVPSDQR